MASDGSLKRVGLVGVLVVGLVLFASAARSQDGFRAWVGLYEPAHLGWLENENRIDELCAEPSGLDECYAEKLGPAVSVRTLYSGPSHSESRVGDLIVVAVPGRGFSAHFRPVETGQSIPFRPDLFLQDWGYGPYFHHSLSSQQGTGSSYRQSRGDRRCGSIVRTQAVAPESSRYEPETFWK